MQPNFKEPNPLNFFGIRRFKVPAQHLEYINMPMTYNIEDAISRWIEENLKGRYFIGKALAVDDSRENNKIASVIRIGFEDPKELSYFTLACPHLKY